jgi:large subunit ribosomal protein L15
VQQHELRQSKGATHTRKRVGRGNASGHGTYSTKGMKGQKARSGGGVRPGFEGGQLPLVRRMAYKRGFRNPFRIDYEELNVSSLANFAAGTRVNAEVLKSARLIRTGRPVKVLGNGDIAVALTVEAASFSKSARSKIEDAGGSIHWLNGEPATEEQLAEEHAAKPKQVRAAKVAAKAAAGAKASADAKRKPDAAEKEETKAEAQGATDDAGS